MSASIESPKVVKAYVITWSLFYQNDSDKPDLITRGNVGVTLQANIGEPVNPVDILNCAHNFAVDMAAKYGLIEDDTVPDINRLFVTIDTLFSV